MEWWLPVLLGGAVAFGIVMYVAMDGFDLGLGILFPFAPGETERAMMLNSIAPFWDGNETWLVLGGTLLIGAFPLAYATLLPAFYVPLLTMLFALIFRGIAFEFRFRATRFRALWDWAFSGGSMLATFCQGLVLGGFIHGIPVVDRAFAGGPLDCISAFAGACGCGLVAGYGLLGATWLIFKTDGSTAEYGRAAARIALPATMVFIALVSLWTPFAYLRIAARWFAWPNIALLSPVPLVTALVALGLWRSIGSDRDFRPFLLAISLFLLAFLGLGISIWPYAVPYQATLWQAASSPPTLAFVGIGVVVILPVVLFYVAFAHWIFRGKTATDTGYGH
ncbi:MAG TPA: cytochrome d ubiquinol oxidase subunit II [Stellaceae bacterium]|jgi:cytochrome d ubiquinol oxidase subunit II|nr:cytochrome d ubiquinol oxidase subunit II [Stellaceae bacterium]